jgi:hypothetical protein
VKGAVAVLAVLLVLVGVRAFEAPTDPLDEFLPLVAAQRVLGGDVPYRDYTSLYPPLTTLLDVVVIGVTGRHLLVTRLVFLAIVAANLLLVRSLAARLTGSERTGTLVGLLAAATHGAPSWGYALVLATSLILGAFAGARRGGTRWTIAAGALLALASLARHDTAFWAALPIAFVVFKRSRREGAILLGTAALGPLALVVALACLGALGAAWHQLVVIPGTLYAGIRGLPFPLPWRSPGDAPDLPSLGSIYGPFLVSALALARAETRASPEKLAAALLPFFLGMNAIVRPDHAHVYAASIASFVPLALIFGSGWRVLGIALALTAPIAVIEGVESARLCRHVLSPHEKLTRGGTRAGMLGIPPWDPERDRALERVAKRPPGTRIFVALPRHDRIWINDVSFYFDSGALPATRHHELYALVATTDEVQAEIVRDLERAQPPCVVVVKVRPAWEPNASARTFTVRALDYFIASHY